MQQHTRPSMKVMSGRNAPRSRTGCATCRTRKIKCDETHPSCVRCVNAQMQCEWIHKTPRKVSRSRPALKVSKGPGLQRTYHPLRPRNIDASMHFTSLFLPDSHCLSSSEREYFEFFPHTSMVRWLGKPWQWASLHYVYSHIAPHSSVVTRMILAISATELEGIRHVERLRSDQIASHDQWPGEAGTSHYQSALREFQLILSNSQGSLSPHEVDEISTAFFLMVTYEYLFGQDSAAVEVHIQGIYTFLKAHDLVPRLGETGQCVKLPVLTQQLLLFVMYANLTICKYGRLRQLWEEAGHESSFISTMDELFYNSRTSQHAIWPFEYPSEAALDDISVFRPLELTNECKKLKYRLLLIPETTRGKSEWYLMDCLEQDLCGIGKRYQDLIIMSQQPHSDLRNRQLQTIYFAVAEYHATTVFFCYRRSFLSCMSSPLVSSRDAVNGALAIIKELSTVSPSCLGRVHWPMIVLARCMEDSQDRQWIRKTLIESQHTIVFPSMRGWLDEMSGLDL
ncbi:hypothetical protein BDV24DRAFT_141482 [Aspergillus arachidicola]|uniref:Zn(2)-C6 fungal-type domain-containing protein n=1 Tax=Aspergillus arachidicola TaxID=656916 RepID=A0A5N6XTT4_9EURO|nr:hypothetical protein BDV24DRAFT_141482 [Aspergillus arachidicola]